MAVAVVFIYRADKGETVAGFFMNDSVKGRDDMGDGSRRRFRLDTGCALGTSGTSVQHGISPSSHSSTRRQKRFWLVQCINRQQNGKKQKSLLCLVAVTCLFPCCPAASTAALGETVENQSNVICRGWRAEAEPGATGLEALNSMHARRKETAMERSAVAFAACLPTPTRPIFPDQCKRRRSPHRGYPGFSWKFMPPLGGREGPPQWGPSCLVGQVLGRHTRGQPAHPKRPLATAT